MALSRPELLLNVGDLTVGGFCGQKRPGVERGPIERLDRALIAEFPKYTDLLNYNTLQTEDGNLLLLRTNFGGLATLAAEFGDKIKPYP